MFGDKSDRRNYFKDYPWFTLPEGFSFMVIFPFTGAVARFRVCKTGKPENSVSVYLDTKNILGCFDGEYWEAYPINGDTERFALSEGKELIDAIVAELNKNDVTIET